MSYDRYSTYAEVLPKIQRMESKEALHINPGWISGHFYFISESARNQEGRDTSPHTRKPTKVAIQLYFRVSETSSSTTPGKHRRLIAGHKT